MYNFFMDKERSMALRIALPALAIVLVSILTAPEAARGATLYEQTNISTLGDDGITGAQAHANLPVQELGTGLSGTVRALSYKVNWPNIIVDMGLGYPVVKLYSCTSGFYSTCAEQASGNGTTTSQTGDDAYMLVD